MTLALFAVMSHAAAMSFALAQIPDELRMGREHALLGDYDTSLVYYDTARSTVKKQADSTDGAPSVRAWLRGCRHGWPAQ